MNDCAYISRRLPIQPAQANAALDSWHRNLPRTKWLPRSVRCGGGLWISTEPQPQSVDGQQLSTIRGVLWFGGRPIRVHLELAEWSATACEVAIRPSRLTWPVLTQGYALRVVALLDGISASLVAADVHQVVVRETRVLTPFSAALWSAA
jgi:hypothetical protein